MSGLMWLARGPGWEGWPFCLTFVRDSDERTVLTGFGANMDEAGQGSPEDPSVSVGRSAGWVVALEMNVLPWGTRPDVLRAISAGTEAVAIFQDIGKYHHQFAHARDGEVITALTTFVPPQWTGTDPERLRPLAEELGLGAGADADLSELEVLLALGEGVFGLSLDEADLDRFSPPVPLPAPPPRPAPPRVFGPGPEMERVRAHAQNLINAGMADEAIVAQGGLTTRGLARLLSGQLPVIAEYSAQRILAIEVPTGDGQ
jgi:hypothetical protein